MMTAGIRRWHSYVGFFTAPSLLFFSLSGAVQLFSLHESHGNYQPPALLEKLASVHKDQIFALGEHHPAPGSDSDAGKFAEQAAKTAPDDEDKPAIITYLLKWFFLLVALSLAASTILGLWIGLTLPNRKRIALPLMLAGALIPLGLLLF